MADSCAARVIDDFDGTAVWPDHDDFDARRKVWNAMHDRTPAVIARCTSAADVAAAIAYARRHGVPLAVRGGGHGVPGYSVCDDGVVIDLRNISSVDVDPIARVARIGGGALLGEVDRATQEHGLLVPAGVVSHTGVGGLTLGGGVGRMMRRFGLTIDSLRSVQIVTADGAVLRASATEHPDLFWAVRGGGGNFGVVTEFEFDLHPLTELLVLGTFHRLEDAPTALAVAQRTMAAAPDELTWSSFPRQAYPQPWLPHELVGTHGVLSFIEWSGAADEGAELLEQLRDELAAAASGIATVPFVVLQTVSDEMYGHGKRSYFKSGFFDALSSEVVATLIEQTAQISSPFTQLEILSMGGAVKRVDADATAFPNRDASWLVNVPSTWLDAAEDEQHIAWVRDTYRRLEPLMAEGSYVNFMDADDREPGDAERRLDTTFGATLERLREIKRAYDPHNVFRLNQNILPAELPQPA